MSRKAAWAKDRAQVLLKGRGGRRDSVRLVPGEGRERLQVEENYPPTSYLRSPRLPGRMQDSESSMLLDGVEVAIVVEQ